MKDIEEVKVFRRINDVDGGRLIVVLGVDNLGIVTRLAVVLFLIIIAETIGTLATKGVNLRKVNVVCRLVTDLVIVYGNSNEDYHNNVDFILNNSAINL